MTVEKVLEKYFTNPASRLDAIKRAEAMTEWHDAVEEAYRAGYAAHARDLEPMHNATARSIRIRTGKLTRFLDAQLTGGGDDERQARSAKAHLR